MICKEQSSQSAETWSQKEGSQKGEEGAETPNERTLDMKGRTPNPELALAPVRQLYVIYSYESTGMPKPRISEHSLSTDSGIFGRILSTP